MTSCLVVLKTAASVGTVLVTGAGGLIARMSGRALPQFVWDGAACVMDFFDDEDDTVDKRRLPDISEPLAALAERLAPLGTVRFIVEIVPHKAKPDPQRSLPL